jgi:Helix-turn-helix of DDE superfamily endonuclease
MKQSQNYTSLSKSAKQFKAVLGLDLEFFDYLDLYFKDQLDAYDAEFTILGEPRKRSASIRKNSNFENSQDKLCFVLMYLKNNSLQETLASSWGMLQPRANVWIHLLLKILLQTLKELNFVPASNSEELAVLLKKTEVVFLDGTERSIQRPLHKEEQKRHYSGKKKPHYKKQSDLC